MKSPHVIIQRIMGSGGPHSFSFNFGPGLNIIEGPVGTGKSSLLEFAKFLLGGDGILSQAIRDNIEFGELEIRVDGETFTLRRSVRGSNIELLSSGAIVETLSATDSKTHRSAGHGLLELLGIPAVRIPRSRLRPGAASTPITFFDVLDLMYLPQDEIDRSVAHHLDAYRDTKRRATFELLYGLTDPELTQLEVAHGDASERLLSERRRASDIRTFLTEASPQGIGKSIERRKRLLAERDAAEAELRAFRADVGALTSQEDPARRELVAVEQSVEQLRQQVAEARGIYDQHSSLVAQLDVELERESHHNSAREALGGIEFTICPRCLQRLKPTQDASTCPLCQQPEPTAVEPARLEFDRLMQQRNETHELVQRDLESVRAIGTELEIEERRARTLRRAVDERTDRLVTPAFDRLQTLAERAATANAELDRVDRTLHVWERLRALDAEVSRLETSVEALSEAIGERRRQLKAGSERVGQLSEFFAETITDFELPWYGSPRIDSRTYLPIVGAQSFEELVSGGMKTLVNVAYYLAHLRFGIALQDSWLPRLLMIDSPRKNLGRNQDDQRRGDRVYRRLEIIDMASHDKMQLIVADNDVPKSLQHAVRVPLSYESPLVPWVVHPGEGKVESIKA